jgi:hypothetical protein
VAQLVVWQRLPVRFSAIVGSSVAYNLPQLTEPTRIWATICQHFNEVISIGGMDRIDENQLERQRNEAAKSAASKHSQ